MQNNKIELSVENRVQNEDSNLTNSQTSIPPVTYTQENSIRSVEKDKAAESRTNKKRSRNAMERKSSISKPKPKIPDNINLDLSESKIPDIVDLEFLGMYRYDAVKRVYRTYDRRNGQVQNLSTKYTNLASEFIPISQYKNVKFNLNKEEDVLELSRESMDILRDVIIRNPAKPVPYNEWVFSPIEDDFFHFTQWGEPTSRVFQDLRDKHSIQTRVEFMQVYRDDQLYNKNFIRISKKELNKWHEIFKVEPKIIDVEAQALKYGYKLPKNNIQPEPQRSRRPVDTSANQNRSNHFPSSLIRLTPTFPLQSQSSLMSNQQTTYEPVKPWEGLLNQNVPTITDNQTRYLPLFTNPGFYLPTFFNNNVPPVQPRQDLDNNNQQQFDGAQNN